MAPLPAASSGKTDRHRLNHGGDGDANRALWRIAITRMATDPSTRTYVQRRTKHGKDRQEIIRLTNHRSIRRPAAGRCRRVRRGASVPRRRSTRRTR
ncbi:transposase [Actinoallomurus acaciae]|uniref:Transposase n=1 Tax=Actinoallomurus acaciae TaxID=502577 RepID=A0ABV5YNK2_9ACTN